MSSAGLWVGLIPLPAWVQLGIGVPIAIAYLWAELTR